MTLSEIRVYKLQAAPPCGMIKVGHNPESR